MRRRWDKRKHTIKQAYHYRPRTGLIYNLAHELNLSEEQVRKQIRDERLWLLQQDWPGENIGGADI